MDWKQYWIRRWLVVPHAALLDGLEIPADWRFMQRHFGRRTRSMTNHRRHLSYYRSPRSRRCTASTRGLLRRNHKIPPTTSDTMPTNAGGQPGQDLAEGTRRGAQAATRQECRDGLVTGFTRLRVCRAWSSIGMSRGCVGRSRPVVGAPGARDAFHRSSAAERRAAEYPCRRICSVCPVGLECAVGALERVLWIMELGL